MIKYLFLLILFIPCFLKAQSDSAKSSISITPKDKIIDSLTKKLSKDSARIYRFQKVRPVLIIDNRNSVINGRPVVFRGLQLGLVLFEKNTVGLGFYNMSQNSRTPVAVLDGTISAQRSVSMKYFTLFYFHSFIEKRYFQLNIPLEIGIGDYQINFSDPKTKNQYRSQSGGMIPLGFGLEALFKPTPWVGISVLLGYRVVAEKDVSQHFNGAYSSIGLTFHIRQIHRDIRYYCIKRRHYRKEVKKLLKH